MMGIIILFLSFLLDGILTNYLPYLPNTLTYRKETKKYYLHMFLLGIFYDLFYTNLLFWNAILFLEIAYLSQVLYKNFEITFFQLIFLISIIVIVYESSNAFILFSFQLVPITFTRLFYKIIHSLLLNIFYIQFVYLILKVIPKKYKKISIN